MSAQHVQVTVGPVDAPLALAWVQHWLAVLDAVDRHVDELSISVRAGATDRLRSVLATWESIAESSSTFWWRFATTDASLELVEDWLNIGQLTDDDLALLGAAWAPDWMRPMTDAVVEGVAAALVALGERGEDLRGQIDRPS